MAVKEYVSRGAIDQIRSFFLFCFCQNRNGVTNASCKCHCARATSVENTRVYRPDPWVSVGKPYLFQVVVCTPSVSIAWSYTTSTYLCFNLVLYHQVKCLPHRLDKSKTSFRGALGIKALVAARGKRMLGCWVHGEISSAS